MSFEQEWPKLVIADESSPFNLSPEEWGKMTEAITARAGDRPAWIDISADEIISELLKVKKKVERAKWEVPGVTLYAGRTAYAEIRNMFPEDSEMVKVVECAHLGDSECLVAKNEGIARLRESALKMSRDASSFRRPQKPRTGDSSRHGKTHKRRKKGKRNGRS